MAALSSQHSALSTRNFVPRRLDPVADRDHAEMGGLRLATADRINCAICEKLFVGSVVITGEPEPAAPRAGGYFIQCQIYCDHCNHVQTWLQACDADGSIHSGRPLSGPGFIKDPKSVARFLRAHPEASGVSQI